MTNKKAETKREPRAYLYSSDCPEGRIFTGAEAIAEAEDEGWVDSPAKLQDEEQEMDEQQTGGTTQAAGTGGRRRRRVANGNNSKKSD